VALGVLWLFFQREWLSNLLVPPAKEKEALDLVIQTTAPTPPPPPEKVLLPLDQLGEKPRMDSAGLQEAKSAPVAAAFQSDRDLVAGSLAPPTGSLPLPTVEGRKGGQETSLIRQEARLGSLEAQPPKPSSSVAKLAAGKASPKAAAAAKKSASRYKSGGELARMEELPELGGELVFRRLAAGPSSAQQSGATAVNPVAPKPAEASQKSEAEPLDDLFQEGKERAGTKGGLAENGKLGVNASKTPMGVYMKSVSRAIGAKWNLLVKNRMDSLETGLVKVRFWITADGSVRRVVIERSTANRAFSELCLEAVKASQLEPPPEEAKPLLQDGLLEIPFTFSLY
jgi:TonB family protein